ncbi:MAG: hypothetical protein JXA96_11160 [Sedimentisphaerales bacterium]|nr:hypothetical protein [Sedimentisphaerales bacterium]
MAKKTIIWLAASFVLCSSFGGTIYAQNEQWLQYHSARELNLVGISSTTKLLELSDKQPTDVDLPKFTGDSQYFTKWMTPMVEKGFLWIALDRSHKLGMYDILYIDSNGDGQLADEEPIRQYRMEQTSSYFGPVKVVFKLADGPTSYHLNFRYYGYDDTKRLYVSTGGWYQGEVDIDGQKQQCVLLDYNANGTFNDKALVPENSDRIRISNSTDSKDTSFVGNYVQINNKFYEPEIARDGAFIKLAEAKDIKYGKIRLPESVTEIKAGGMNGQFTVEPENGIGTLPVGKYRINGWIVKREDDKGSKWELEGLQSQSKGLFDIKEDEEIALEIGEPIISTVAASYREGSYAFSQQLKGKNGENINLKRNGSRPQAPQLNIKNKDGTYDRTYTFSYG